MIKINYLDSSIIKQFSSNEICCAYFLKRFNDYTQKQNKLNVYCEYLLLKELLKSININLDKQTIVKQQNGKPVFKELKLYFSISHSKNIVAVAISNKPIGIDVQAISQANFKVAQRYFNKQDNKLIEKAKNKNIIFTQCWAKYESIIKLYGSHKILTQNRIIKVKTKTKLIKDISGMKYCLCTSTSKHFSLDNNPTV